MRGARLIAVEPRPGARRLAFAAALACLAVLAAVPLRAAANGTIDLTGEWKFKGDWVETGLSEGWQKVDLDDSQWRSIRVPGDWETQGVTTNNPRYPASKPEDGYSGVAWYRRHFAVPADWDGSEATFRVGKIDDRGEVYVNGELIGSAPEYRLQTETQEFPIPKGLLKPGADNVVAVRVLDAGGLGGITEGPVEIARLAPESAQTRSYAKAHQGDMVRVGGGVDVPADMEVDGNVVAVGGDVTVSGHVKGDVVATGGSVIVKGDGRVDGNATAVGGKIEREGSGRIGGNVVEMPLIPSDVLPKVFHRGPWRWWGLGGVGVLGRTFSFIRHLLIWGFIGLIAVLLFPARLEVMARALPMHPGRAAVYGVSGLVVALPALAMVVVAAAIIAIFLAITVVGILVIPAIAAAIPAAVLGLAILLFLGVSAIFLSLGRAIAAQFGRATARPVWAMLIGVLVVAVALEVPFIGPLVYVTLAIFGFGVAIMTGAGGHEDWANRRLGIRSPQVAQPGPQEGEAASAAPAAPTGAENGEEPRSAPNNEQHPCSEPEPPPQ